MYSQINIITVKYVLVEIVDVRMWVMYGMYIYVNYNFGKHSTYTLA